MNSRLSFELNLDLFVADGHGDSEVSRMFLSDVVPLLWPRNSTVLMPL